MRARVTVRCYAELNDFLSPERRQVPFDLLVHARTSVRDLLEGLGVPHTEIDLLLVNGESSSFSRPIADGDRVAAFPVFEAFDIAGVTRVRPDPLREVRFVLDGHLGRLAAYLRLAGFDALYRREASDAELAAVASAEHRVLLTRDQALLKRRSITHGSYVHATDPSAQLAEVVRRLQIARLARPFTRCTRCNGVLAPAAKERVAEQVPPRSRQHYQRFLQCATCGRVYWEGSHHARLQRLLDDALGRP